MKHEFDFDESLPQPFYFDDMNLEKGFGRLYVKIYRMLVEKQLKKYKPSDSVSFETEYYNSFDNSLQKYYVIKPVNSSGKLKTFIYYHGGGFLWPFASYMAEMMCQYAEELGVQVLIPEYRTSPEYHSDTIIGDCWHFLQFVKNNAEKLNVDLRKLYLYGDSAGGALASSVALLNRDRNFCKISGMFLIFPAVDNGEKYKSFEEYAYAPWSKTANRHAWNMYLGKNENEYTKYAVPIKCDLHGFPVSYVEFHQMDLLRDQGIAFAEKLEKSGVKVYKKLVEKSYHGADTQFDSKLSKDLIQYRINLFKEIIENE